MFLLFNLPLPLFLTYRVRAFLVYNIYRLLLIYVHNAQETTSLKIAIKLDLFLEFNLFKLI